jgi:hypothetical protein
VLTKAFIACISGNKISTFDCLLGQTLKQLSIVLKLLFSFRGLNQLVRVVHCRNKLDHFRISFDLCRVNLPNGMKFMFYLMVIKKYLVRSRENFPRCLSIRVNLEAFFQRDS